MNKNTVAALKSVKRMPAKTLARIGATDFLRDLDLSQDELLALLDLTQQVKAQPVRFSSFFRGKNLVLLFEKPSLRTRITFELAMKQLGG
ncbi:MAG TPA: ornithine carbamoyltransferase, partial [Bryobacteraceae bacterium]|nr:ornithine carbamoyltransferase [Bryobacteraceae bacterium]